MQSEFRARLQSTGLIPPGARVLVGYSGGADSTCLLHLLTESGIDVVGGHLHHGQRPEADEEASRCADFAAKLGIEFASGKVDVPAIALDRKIGLEEAGRQARYAWFRSAMAATGCSLAATAHTMDDHAETVLFNLARGSGMAGLGGISQRSGDVVRPLLGFRRAETRAYCVERGFWFHDDPANADLAHSRTRVRLRVIPELEAAHPGAAEALARFAEIVRDEDAFLDGMAAAVLEAGEVKLNGELWFLTKDCEAAFRTDALLAAPKVLLARALRLLAEHFGAGLDRSSTLSLVDALRGSGGSWTLEGGQAVFEWDSAVLHVRRLQPDVPFRFGLEVPGTTESAYFGWKFEVRPASPSGFKVPRGALEAVVDAQSLSAPLHFRTAEAGDTMRPLGAPGTKKLSDVFQESGLTKAARLRLPVVCDTVGPVWVPGIALAERVKITENSRQGLLILLAPFPT